MKNSSSTEPNYMTPDDIGERLKLTAVTVRKLLVNGDMCRFIRVGKAIRVRRELFEEWAALQEEGSFSPGVRRLC